MKTAQGCDDWRQTFCCRLEFCVCIKILWLLMCLCFLMHLRQTRERPSQKQLAESRCLTDQRRAEWLFVLEAFPLQSAWLLAGWHSGFSYRPASWRSCIQFVSRLRVEIALINALTVILTQGFFSLGFVLTVVGKCTVGSEGWHRLCTVLIDWLMAISIKVFSLVCSLTRLDFESTMMGQ